MNNGLRVSVTRWPGLLLGVVFLFGGAAPANQVQQGYIDLQDGTQLHYTLTTPDGDGPFPTLMKYDPYDAGVASDVRWVDDGYAMIGVNFRGTGCSSGVFEPLNADIWGQDGADAIEWIAQQAWSDGSVGMYGYSFTGVSQLATAAFAGPALKAISPWNVFSDFYRDMTYPGGIPNIFIPLWVLAGRAYVGSDVIPQIPTIEGCAPNVAGYLPGNSVETTDILAHPYDDEIWDRQPAAWLDRISQPTLGCGNWQDTTIYSRAINLFRDVLPRATTWFVGANGTHYACPTPHEMERDFFDRFVRGDRSAWNKVPHVQLFHEIADDLQPRWISHFESWDDVAEQSQLHTLYLRADGSLRTEPEAMDAMGGQFMSPAVTANIPRDWTLTINGWNRPVTPGSVAQFTTPALAEDVEIFGNASADVWVSTSAVDADIQVTLSEVRPDGQEMYVENGWLRLSHAALDAEASSALQPVHTHQQADAQVLTPTVAVPARIEILPFNHVFRAGSSLRLSFDTPGGWFAPLLAPVVNIIHVGPQTPSALVFGALPTARSVPGHAPCNSLVNQPCRVDQGTVPTGMLSLPTRSLEPDARSNPSAGAGGALPLCWVMLLAGLLGVRDRRRSHLPQQ